MPLDTAIVRAFSTGELAPSVGGRADLELYTRGLRTCRNHIVRRQGGVYNRPGTQFVAMAKTDTRTFLFPFIFAAANLSFVIEAGAGYFRFHKDGAPVVDEDGEPIEIATPYDTGDFMEPAPLCFTQSGFTVTITGLAHAPRELTYDYATGTWSLTVVTTAPKIAAPTGLSSSGSVASGPAIPADWSSATTYALGDVAMYSGTIYVSRTGSNTNHTPTDLMWWIPQEDLPPDSEFGTLGSAGSGRFAVRSYVVTAISGATPQEESVGSSPLLLTNVLGPTTAAPIAIAFSAVTGAVEYKVYLDAAGNGVYGFIGRTATTTFNDTGVAAPDYLNAPPQVRLLFDSENNYPAVNTTYQQRRFFAGTHTDRELVWASRIGHPSNFSIRIPLQDDDALTWKLASRWLQPVMHLVGLDRLIAFTDTGIWLVYGDADGATTPTRLNLDQKGYIGAGPVTPVVIGDRIVYVQARNSRVRDLFYKREVSGYEGMGSRDLTVLAGHLFTNHTIESLVYAHEPEGLIWATRDDGTLLGCTYVAEDDTLGWHRHDTKHGAFEQLCVIPEGREDRLYAVVARTIDGDTRRYIERLSTRFFTELEDGVFLDSAVTYRGAATTTITGLAHLEDADVWACADGVRQGPFTVDAGSITLPTAASVVHVGLEIEADLELLDLDVQGTDLRARRKTVQAVQLLLEQSGRTFKVGPDADHLIQHRAELWDTSALADGIEEINVTGAFRPTGRVFIRHTDPTPLAINAVLPVFEAGS